MEGSRLLLTGASGFVGTHLSSALWTRYPGLKIMGTGTRSADGFRNLDLLDSDLVDRIVGDLKPDIVVHLAAQASAALSAKDVGATWSVNLGGSMNLALAIARHCPEATVLFASSAEVYGASFLNGPASEGTPLMPLSPYAKSKAAAERMFADVLPHTARLIIARPFNHTGPGQREDFVLASFAAQIARIEAGLQPPELKVGNLDVRRDFLDVRDVVEAYCALLDVALRLPHRCTCNVSSGKAVSIRQLLDLLVELSTAVIEVTPDPQRVRPADLPVIHGRNSLLAALTGWMPRTRPRETASSLIEYARNRIRSDSGSPNVVNAK